MHPHCYGPGLFWYSGSFIALHYVRFFAFHSCFSTWEVSAQGLQEEVEEDEEEKIAVMDHKSNIAHVSLRFCLGLRQYFCLSFFVMYA